MDDRDLHATLNERVRRFQPQQTTPDNDRSAIAPRRFEHCIDIRQVAKRDDAMQIYSRNRQDDRLRAGRDQESIVGRLQAVARAHDAPAAIDADDRVAHVQSHPVLRVPLLRVEDDFLDALLS